MEEQARNIAATAAVANGTSQPIPQQVPGNSSGDAPAKLTPYQASKVQRMYVNNKFELSRHVTVAAGATERRVDVPGGNGNTWQIRWNDAPVGYEAHNLVEHQWMPDRFVAGSVRAVMACFDKSSSPPEGNSKDTTAAATGSKPFIWVTGPEHQSLLDKTLRDLNFTFSEQYILMADLTKISVSRTPGQLHAYYPKGKGIGNAVERIVSYTPLERARIHGHKLLPEFLAPRQHPYPSLSKSPEDVYLELALRQMQQGDPKMVRIEKENITIAELNHTPGDVKEWVDAWACQTPPGSEQDLARWTNIFNGLRRTTPQGQFHMFAAVRTTTTTTINTANTNIPHAQAAGYPTSPPQNSPFQSTVTRQIIGTGFLHLHSGLASLHAIVVRPEYRRRGIGAALITYALRHARERGYDRSTITVAKDVGHAVFRGLGFQTLAGTVGLWGWYPALAAAPTPTPAPEKKDGAEETSDDEEEEEEDEEDEEDESGEESEEQDEEDDEYNEEDGDEDDEENEGQYSDFDEHGAESCTDNEEDRPGYIGWGMSSQ
ncbi:hypothetical protein F5X99DRAFT_151049 [Biscogniauxia marginata]|nr:hypothetical protein F5X99DRAFT_151049 [Biscogniauxia marginata]